MSHYAKINSQGIVEQVIVAEQEFIDTLSDKEYWIKTSYNTYGNQHPLNKPFRKNYAGIGYKYDVVRDAFIPPKTYNSWVLNEETCLWESPKPYPNDGKSYSWNEEQLNWIEE